MPRGTHETDRRPSPDAMLESVAREERARLKVFVGSAPGVGKTYAMLQAARQKQAEGCEVVVGIVETHGRKETEALLEGMPIIPRTQVEYCRFAVDSSRLRDLEARFGSWIILLILPIAKSFKE